MNARLRKLPRLDRNEYRGLGPTHWIFSVEGRKTGWLTREFHQHFREIVVHAGIRYACVAPVYCLMPDHVHVLLWGYADHSDARLAATFLRRHTAKALLPARYQKQAYDHVLNEHERNRDAFEAVCNYVLENPVRANLCSAAVEYPFSGSVIPGYPDLRVHEQDFWDLFWRIVHGLAA